MINAAMAKLTLPLTAEQQVAMAIIPKFTASLSMLGSGYITHHVLSDRRRRGRVYHRVLLGMSLMDLISSFKSFLSTWPTPAGTPGVAFASGTTQTCTAAAFFGHGASLASALYNGSLTIYYFFIINRGWHFRADDRLGRMEKWLHSVPLAVGWSTAVACVPLTLFNSIGWTCWIAPLPHNCRQTYEYGYTTCVRGDNAYVYRYAFFHCWVWLTFILVAALMCAIYVRVLRRERANEQWDDDSRGRKRREQSRKVANQAMLYVGAYYLTWIFPFIQWTIAMAGGPTYTIVLFLQATFVPLQGFFNMCIYVRPRYLRYRERHPGDGAFVALWNVLTTRRDALARPNPCASTPAADGELVVATSRNRHSAGRGTSLVRVVGAHFFNDSSDQESLLRAIRSSLVSFRASIAGSALSSVRSRPSDGSRESDQKEQMEMAPQEEKKEVGAPEESLRNEPVGSSPDELQLNGTAGEVDGSDDDDVPDDDAISDAYRELVE